MHEISHGFGCQTSAEFFLQIEQSPALTGQADTGHEILRDGLFHEATDLVECFPFHHKRRACTHHSPPAIADRLNPAVETLFIREKPVLHPQIAHHRVGVDKGLRGLNQCNLRFEQKSNAAIKKGALGNEVGVEDGNQLSSAVAQTMVEVAGLGIDALRSVQVSAAELGSERFHLRATAVVEHPHLGVGIGQVCAANQGSFEHFDRFAVGGNQNVHVGFPAALCPALLAVVDLQAAIGEPPPSQPERY